MFVGVSQSVRFFVSRIYYAKFTQPNFTKSHEPRQKPLDFAGNLDHFSLGLGSG